MKSIVNKNYSHFLSLLLWKAFWVLFIFSCKNTNSDASKMLTFLGNNDSPKIISGVPGMGDKNLPRNQKVVILFDRPMNISSCIQSFSISPAIQGFYEFNDYSITFSPSTLLSYGTYSYTLTKNCESKEGRDLKDVFTASFTVGEATTAGTTPEVSSMSVYAGTSAECNASTAIFKNFLGQTVSDACMGNSARNKISIQFNKPMDKAATVAAIAFAPTMSANYLWVSDTNLLIEPDFPFGNQTRITTTISTGAQDYQGVRMLIPVSANFQVGTPNLVPAVTSLLLSVGTLADCLAGTATQQDLLTTSVTTGCLGNSASNPITYNFSRPMNPIQTQASISISPSLTGSYVWSNNNQTLVFTPDAKLTYGIRYTITIGQSASSSDFIPVSSSSIYSFTAGGPVTSAPSVQAFGVESQGCSNSFPGTGSVTGGNWSIGSCYWDSTLPVLTPSSYTFRAGDTGNGALGSSVDCADVNTDNFRIIFSNYMEPNSTVNATRLRRLSPPSTVVQLASWSWSDCQAVTPFGCRALTVIFSEMEASCNGSQFGSLGDFNLLRSDNAPAGFPYYLISVDTSARDVNNLPLSSTFNFSMEAK